VYIGQSTPPNPVTTDRPPHPDFDSSKTRPRFFRDCPLFAATRPAPVPISFLKPRRPDAVINAGDPVAGERSIMSKPTLRDMNAPDSSAEPEVTSIKKPADKLSLDKFKSKKEPLAQVATLPTELPILKIADAKDYVRLHPDVDKYWSPELCFVKVPIKGQNKDRLHLIDEDLALKYIPSGRILRFRLALATKPDDVLFLCQIPTRNLDNDWNETALKGIEQAKHKWTLVTSLKEEGIEKYKVTSSEEDDGFDEPTWPIGKQTLEDIILTCFSGFCIDKADHPALLRLRGKKQTNS